MMKKLKLIALCIAALVEISAPVSLYTIISEAEHVAHDNHRLPKKLQPVELMVDATNFLGFKILGLHSVLNKNNIAFSPCGLMSVLVALYEGSSGRSTIELKESLEFPNERDIVRVGVRDIHRRLRSYFYKKENLLSGLIFNKDNITIRPEYETVLRFYGYDLDGASNMLTESKVNDTAQNMTNVTEATDNTTQTTLGNDTSADVDEGKEGEETTTLQLEPSDDEASTTDEASLTEEEGNTEENTQADDEDVTTVAPPSRKRRGRLGRGLKGKNRRDKKQSYRPIIKRRVRSYYVLLDEDYENEFHLESTSPSSAASASFSSPQGSTTAAIPTSTAARTTHGLKYRHSNPSDLFENVDSDTVEHIFYLNEYESVRTPFKIYDTVMKYSHIDSLQASVLEIDLDTEHYNLIIFVPDQHDGLSDLTNKLRLHEPSTLRRIRNNMEFFWVKTIVPKFSLKGNTLLTTDLQNMGISDIFEPTKADFSQLADDKTLYVKNVEQMININIRTQTTQQLKKISSLYKHPVEVPVNVPFIYCVVDKELDLSIIAGRILNPLNSRIQ